ncbi:MAG: TolC family protein [Burkholderiales bacterium]|nr:TolC family protein [Burkholderiales bacterium]
MRKDVEPIVAPLTLNEALARALKYNLDRRTKLMEESLALGQLDVAKFDMLPKLIAGAGYAWRDNDRISNSRDPSTGQAVQNRFISQDRIHNTQELGLTWSLLDYGMGYYGAQQQANRVLIAAEKRRKAMHLLMQDVRTAYWRAASAQLLKADVAKTIAAAQDALKDSRKAESERVKNPLDALRYQRQLLENLRLLESIDQELSSAQVDLSAIINAPIGQRIQLAESDLQNVAADVLDIPVERLEEAALMRNADLREQHYNSNIAREETRRTLVRLFPNVSLNYALKYDTDTFLVNRNWNEAGVQVSFNLFNLATAPTQIKLADAGVLLADQKRVAAQLAVIAQVHLSRLQLINARSQFDRADEIFTTDRKIADVMRDRQSVQAQSKLDLVSNETSAILSLLRRYQALTLAQTAHNRLVATVGLEPEIGSTNELSLKDLVEQIRKSEDPWSFLKKADAAVDVDSPSIASAAGFSAQ